MERLDTTVSDEERNDIMFMLGEIKERTDNQGKMLVAMQVDITAIKSGEHCPLGKAQAIEIAGLGTRIGKIEAIAKKAVLVLLAVGIGSVGVKETVMIAMRLMGLTGE